MNKRTSNNVHKAFIEEAKAHNRLLMFAAQAEKEDLSQIALLFRAVAAAESVHARRHFALLEGSIKDTQSNLERAFQSETGVARVGYAKMLKEAEEDREEAAALVFSQARDVDETHAKLYKKALDHLIALRSTHYYICTICGFVSDGNIPSNCPICGASSTEFQNVE
ncbi:MAG: rubrerythrin family protein [Candidatus Bathyarchaeota archaeon]|nr:MAG: rubrerythrin family protein [Candidatus Bathyarchaeota archaeon]